MQYKRTKNCEYQTKNGALVDDSCSKKNGERSSVATTTVRKNCFNSENINRNENSYTSLLSSFHRENSLIHSSCGIRSINSVIDCGSSNVSAIFNQHHSGNNNPIDWTHLPNTCQLNNRENNYSIRSTCSGNSNGNDPDHLFQSKHDNNVNDNVWNGSWNVDPVGVSKLRTPSNLCKSNRQVPIIRKLTPKVKTKKNEGFECNVIVEQQQHKTKIAQLSVIKQNDNVKSNDDDNDDDDAIDDHSDFILHSNSTADVACLSSTLPYNDDNNLIVCDDRCDDDDNDANDQSDSECLVKNAENHRIVFVEEGCLNGADERYHKQPNFQSKYKISANEFGEPITLRKGLNSDGSAKDHYRCQYKKVSPQGNRRFANTSGSTSLVLLGSNRQYSGIYVSRFNFLLLNQIL